MDSAGENSPKPEETVRFFEPPILATVVDPRELADEAAILAELSNVPPMSLAWPAAKPHPASGYYPEKVYGVTRRFSLATVMLMMAGASVILALMNAFDISPFISGGILLLCVATALGQMLLFGGKQPRKASVIVGGVSVTIASLVGFIGLGATLHGYLPLRVFVAILLSLIVGPTIGSLMGYMAGGLVAGVLLVMDLTELKLARWRKAREPDDDPWPPPKNTEKVDPCVGPTNEPSN